MERTLHDYVIVISKDRARICFRNTQGIYASDKRRLPTLKSEVLPFRCADNAEQKLQRIAQLVAQLPKR